MTQMSSPYILSLPLLLAACSGGMVADLYPGTRVDVDGAAFVVQREGPEQVLVRNFETAPANQTRLRAQAAVAAERVTGCGVVRVAQRPGVNTYDLTLECPGQ